VAKLNVDDNPATVGTCQVWSMPLMGLFRGGELVKLILGARPKPAINGRARGVLTMMPHVTGKSGSSTTTELLEEIRVDAGLGPCAVHAELPSPGGAS
jgi:thioredoxin-like negative regulator of GroEL